MSKITEKTPDAGLKMILLIPKDYNGDSSNITEFLQAADKLGIEVQKDEKNSEDIINQV
ncbi:RTX N-terminal domain protein, partial [Vibrio parahaemolyticus VPTS-2010]